MCVLETVSRTASWCNLVRCGCQTTGRRDVTRDPCTKFKTASLSFKPLNYNGPGHDCYICSSPCFLNPPPPLLILHASPLQKNHRHKHHSLYLTASTEALVRWAQFPVIGYTWRGQGPRRESSAGSLHPQTAAVKWKGHSGIREEECRGPSHSILMFY